MNVELDAWALGKKPKQKGFTSEKNLARRLCSVLSSHPGALLAVLARPVPLQPGPHPQGPVSRIVSDGSGMLWSKFFPARQFPTALSSEQSGGKKQREWLSDSRAPLNELWPEGPAVWRQVTSLEPYPLQNAIALWQCSASHGASCMVQG